MRLVVVSILSIIYSSISLNNGIGCNAYSMGVVPHQSRWTLMILLLATTTSHMLVTATGTDAPSQEPTAEPSISPTSSPISDPPSSDPSAYPTLLPTIAVQPSGMPSAGPAGSSAEPSVSPTQDPTISPSQDPTASPSSLPPTAQPSLLPTSDPTASPSESPTSTPSSLRTSSPSDAPVTSAPTSAPSTSSPTLPPTSSPSSTPTSEPSALPSAAPSAAPTSRPTPVYTTLVLVDMVQTLMNCSASGYKSSQTSSDNAFIDSVVMAIPQIAREWVAVESVEDASVLAAAGGHSGGMYGMSGLQTNSVYKGLSRSTSSQSNSESGVKGAQPKAPTAANTKVASTISYRLSIILESTSFSSPQQCYDVVTSEMTAYVASGQFTSAIQSNAVVYSSTALASAVAESSGYYAKEPYAVINNSPQPSVAPTVFSSSSDTEQGSGRPSISAWNIVILVLAMSLILAVSLIVYFRFFHKSSGGGNINIGISTSTSSPRDRGFMLNLFGRPPAPRPARFAHLDDVYVDDFDAEMMLEGDDEVLWMDKKTQMVSMQSSSSSSNSSNSGSKSTGGNARGDSSRLLSGLGGFGSSSSSSSYSDSTSGGDGGGSGGGIFGYGSTASRQKNSSSTTSSSNYGGSSSSNSSSRRSGTHAIGTIDIY